VAGGIGSNFAPLAPRLSTYVFTPFIDFVGRQRHLFNGLRSRVLLSQQRSIFHMDDSRHIGQVVFRYQLAITGVGVEKVGTNQPIFMRSVWQCEMFSSIV
jgi:hypothetical protein